MKCRIIGGGIYGCHIGLALLDAGHEVELHEIADRLFAGASGNIPARLHTGQHYARSKLTRAACQEHHQEFMTRYGQFTHGVPVNVYAIAETESLVDFGTYCQILRGEIEFITVEVPRELGLDHVEGAILTGERHILVDRLRDHFTKRLGNVVRYKTPPGLVDDNRWDLTVDATFCSHEGLGIDRFEPCLTVLLEGPVDRAITICDGPFGSLYPWDESRGLSTLTSAKFTPLNRRWTYKDAREYLDGVSKAEIEKRASDMLDQMAHFYPRVRDEYRIVGHLLAIRAMPRSAADARLVDVVRVGERALRIRAGKLDAVFHAERVVKDFIYKATRVCEIDVSLHADHTGAAARYEEQMKRAGAATDKFISGHKVASQTVEEAAQSVQAATVAFSNYVKRLGEVPAV